MARYSRPCLRPTHGSAVAILSVIALGLSSGWNGSLAQEWRLASSIEQSFLYSDNLLLSRENEVDTFGLITAPEVRIERRSPTSTVTLDGRFEFEEYINHSEFNSQDQILRLNTEHHLSERSKLRFGAHFIHDTTLTQQREGNDDFDNDAIPYYSWGVEPSWNYLLTPIDDITLRGTYRNVQYSDSDKTDYQYAGPTIAYGHRLSEIDKVTGSVSYFRFIPEEPGDNHTDSIRGLVGYQYTPTPRLDFAGAVGAAYSVKEENDDTSDEVGFVLKVNFDYKLNDQTSTHLALSHDSEPGGDGDPVTRNRASVGVDHRLTELTTVGFDFEYVDSIDHLGLENDVSDDTDSQYLSARPFVSLDVTEELSLVAEYQFRHRVYESGGDDDASSNTVFLSLEYDLPTVAGEGP